MSLYTPFIHQLSIFGKKELGRILGIDYGKRRTGIAVTDELQIIASGLCAIDSKKIFSWLIEYTSNNVVDVIVVGLPVDLQNNNTNITQDVQKLVEKITTQFSKIKVETVDERFTSKIAKQSLFDSGLSKKKRRDKGLVDEVSATIILQSYMQRSGKY